MRLFLAIILIAILAGIAEYFLPWWTIAIVAFIVALFLRLPQGKSFLVGFCGVGLLWLADAILHDIANQHILSRRMAELFHLPGYALFIIVTAIIGGLVGGMAAWSGALLSRMPASRSHR